MRPFLNAGMTKDWLHSRTRGSASVFEGTDLRAYDYLLAHWAKHQVVPPLDEFQKNFPARVLILPEELLPDSELIEFATHEARRLIVAEAATEVVDLHDEDRVDEAAARIREAALRLDAGLREPTGSIFNIGDPEWDTARYLDDIRDPGVPLGIQPIDDTFYGFQPGQLITIMGRQKAGKSWVLLNGTLAAWRAGHSGLLYSVEMSRDVCLDRLYALGAKVDPQKFHKHDAHGVPLLTRKERRRVLAFAGELSDDYGDTDLMISQHKALFTVADVEREIDERAPHAVWIDGFYFLRDPETGASPGSDWKANDNVAAQLKVLAEKKQVPVIVTTQVKEKQYRGGVITADTIKGGGGLLEYSDLVLGQNKDDDDMRTLSTVLSRFAWPDDYKFWIDWDTMEFSEASSGGVSV
jgi:hypothetical protein